MKHLVWVSLIILSSIGHSRTTYGPYPLRVQTENPILESQLGWARYFVIDNDYNYDIRLENRKGSATCVLGLANGQSETWVVDERSSLVLKGFRVPLIDVECYKNHRS